jgi:uncharacterized ion transporter superfamily protein YfcC
MEDQNRTRQRKNLILSITGLAIFILIFTVLIRWWRKYRSNQDTTRWQQPQLVYSDIKGLTEEEASTHFVDG